MLMSSSVRRGAGGNAEEEFQEQEGGNVECGKAGW